MSQARNHVAPENVPHYRVVEFLGRTEAGVKLVRMPVVSINGVLDGLFAPYKGWDFDWDDQCDAIRVWAEANNAYLYSRVREDFFMEEALRLAHKDGKTILAVEDMS